MTSPTITDGTTSVVPRLVTVYKSKRPSRSIIHAILSSPSPAVSLRPAGLRTGSVNAQVVSRSAAVTLESLLSTAHVCTYTDPDATLSMFFVVDGDIEVEQDSEVLIRWWVKFPFQEVAP